MSDPTVAAAAEAIRAGSKSFAVASRLFDRRTREGATLLYAWCRHCDDVVDDQRLGFRTGAGGATTPAVRLAELESATRAALRGEPSSEPAFAALAEVMRRHAIPEALPLAHLAGFRMDVEGRRYGALDDTLDYSWHVAGVVGVMMAHVMGVRDRATLERAADLGLAFQLTNIARDIVDDAGAGRVYLPADWLAEVGIPATELAEKRHRAALAALAGRLVDAAEPYYASAAIGIAGLPPRAAWAVATAKGVYRQIGSDVKALGPRAWDRRVSTSTAAKLRHVATGTLALVARSGSRGASRDGLYGQPIQP